MRPFGEPGGVTRAGKGWEVFPEGREESGDPPKRGGRSLEALPEGRDGS